MGSARIRFAFRLAISLGIPDPIAWIDTVDPYVLDCWLAYDSREPIPYPWLQSATIAAEAYRTTSFISAGNGAVLDSRAVRDFMPRTSAAKQQQSGEMTPEQMTAWAASMVNLRK
ncbi:hypothetical protein [Allorhodopirellula heiligendammensis]|uniref:Uncharacterized protein n=1 Tax=Allorhodopirellula heiligendammensis TaxID=2714739 RepID=A0A5C6C811_9BACT|nr:hypothetical protein [Allorhodopirellula heiligendammensis]TWU19566.1 hypothetical protein Poly21_17400 [Allorhodopirellula heiligendammensis]